ncbi:unnamed protein product [Ilex paraguariensis]|uniref:Uncharacterized protein n=1 Tax=Ilex paraguariensis TaxID=185542 RepID=A0ABC8UB12_9AQUA
MNSRAEAGDYLRNGTLPLHGTYEGFLEQLMIALLLANHVPQLLLFSSATAMHISFLAIFLEALSLARGSTEY